MKKYNIFIYAIFSLFLIPNILHFWCGYENNNQLIVDYFFTLIGVWFSFFLPAIEKL
jgi:hypothetical protein